MRDIGATSSTVSHQTVKLGRGNHASPDEGVCVMELASMLAEEEFSDHPRSVCPVIGAFLRAYNDRVDDRRRQDLYEYAAKVVGTRSTAAVERDRAQMCHASVQGMKVRGAVCEDSAASSDRRRLRRWVLRCRRELAGRRAGLAFGGAQAGYGGLSELDFRRHRAGLCFLDQLIAVGGCDESQLDQLGISDPSDPRTCMAGGESPAQ